MTLRAQDGVSEGRLIRGRVTRGVTDVPGGQDCTVRTFARCVRLAALYVRMLSHSLLSRAPRLGESVSQPRTTAQEGGLGTWDSLVWRLLWLAEDIVL